ncbi:enoyl-CoA hydratase/carnithine racemase [Thermocatellispora tengchongensis]|uniref:Enoyl-CoA hydratase/carnithine racemase n=1 Tax=Thermocatellispora tengchongensis TaxID=1073253 RepID=A0A840PCY6_9ACTN|nr:enoyl-CoA hydratase-related protein [Thermocatellispora tengchongensis]MBB5136849.1 enoyl-CoA hydratase/carnithine racemase [Thermocatellispora tengchongensis]
MSGGLDVEREAGCARVVLRRPEVHNALSLALLAELDRTLRELDADDDVGVIVLVGEGGRAFSSGFDLRDPSARGRRPVPHAYPDVTRQGELPGFDALERCATPVVAAIDGYCLGGGLELALLCDLRIATRGSSFGLPEPHRGMLGGAGLAHLSRSIPLGEALWLHLTGGRMSADRAYQIGLVQALADDAESLTRLTGEVAAQILRGSPLAVQFIKRIVREGRELSVQQQWRFAEMFNFVLRGSDDAAEGPRAFAERREPAWTRPRPEAAE